ncbi:alpha/beta fold hydrolase [Sphingobium sp. BHU LFT2]|uniref:alpha/beta hydrolase family protein n=1 Tax=Sphingobium sp. BHU LFT2 TaxID=2807634 RepID=UPI001BE66992|nr:alpha/beta hydrolase [Sphingobium sp. BHU LFT2]MBT2244136.1 alpha/beta fold hydrolase [Sphingobium sp. BHU LFT2]
MRAFWLSCALLSCAATPAIAREPAIHPAVTTDPAPDAANPARMDAFVIPSGEGAMNAVMYVAAGSGVHPTLLLLHGFPGNEQNLDLAQAARRAGWNVLTLHYRGSWGSPGIFSFANAAEDAFNALLFLEEASTVAKYRIDTSAIVVAGHSMGGFMAAEAAAAEPRVAGLFLIDPWDPAQTVASLATPQGEAGWKAEVAGDLPPLSGASYESLTAEIKDDGQKFDLGRKLVGYGRRPLTIIGAERGIGAMARKVGADAQSANPNTRLMVWPTDHSFSDKRIALADALVRFLAGVAPTLR